MAKINEIQAMSIYKDLKRMIDECIEKNDWEFYKGKVSFIAKYITEIKRYLENRPYMGPRDERWALELEDFKSVLQKIDYHTSHLEDLTLIDTNDNNSRCIF